jgi:phosphoglucosamine mutase
MSRSNENQQKVSRPTMGGTDGYRGKYGQKITESVVYGLTLALIESFESSSESSGTAKKIVVGNDNRASSDSLVAQVIAAARSLGYEVGFLGLASTPVVQFSALKEDYPLAVIITASHNPHTDNGWKGFIFGKKPDSVQVRQISDKYWQLFDEGRIVEQHLELPQPNRTDLIEKYVTALVKEVEAEFGELPLKGRALSLDSANGACSKILPEVFKRLGADCRNYFCDSKALINDGCGATDLSGLRRVILDDYDILSRTDLIGGVTIDGDGDRFMGLGVKFEEGQPLYEELDGNKFLVYRAKSLVDSVAETRAVVGTVYTNPGVVNHIKTMGCDFFYCDNGDKNVTRELLKRGLRYGSEFSGHHIDLRWLLSGDGVMAAAWIACYVSALNMNFYDAASQVKLWPEHRESIHCEDPTKEGLKDQLTVIADSHRYKLGEAGALLLLPSGTEPKVRIFASSSNQDKVNEVVDEVKAEIEKIN